MAVTNIVRKNLSRPARTTGGISLAIASLMSSSAIAQQSGTGYGPHMMWGGGYGMIFGPLFMILVLVVTVAGAVVLARWIGGSWQAAPAGRTPLDILKERFARGEIDRDEFEDRRRVLGE